jgi:hypothetical protein
MCLDDLVSPIPSTRLSEEGFAKTSWFPLREDIDCTR